MDTEPRRAIRAPALLAAAALALCLSGRPLMAGEPGAGSGAPLDFDSEVVRLTIVGDSLQVDGLYRFLSRPSLLGPTPILYPYPVDPRLGTAHMVSLLGRTEGTAWRAIRFTEAADLPGAVWHLPADQGDTLEVQAVYRQALRARFARYIVTTTASWGRPLRRARFEITLPAGAKPTRFSHPFRRTGPKGRRVYLFDTRRFLPGRDIEVEWAP